MSRHYNERATSVNYFLSVLMVCSWAHSRAILLIALRE